MKIDNAELQKEFYETIQSQYPSMSFEEMKECTSTQYIYTRQNIESGKLPVIRLQYFGTFLVYRRKAEGMLVNMKTRFTNLKLDAKTYFEKKAMIDNFLEKYNEDINFIDDGK